MAKKKRQKPPKKYIVKELYVVSDIKTGTTDIKDHETHKPVDLISYISDMIDLSVSEKSEVKVYVDGLSYIKLELLNYFYKMGYNFECKNNKKSMKVKDVRYSLGKSQMYYYQAKTGSYSFVTFQNVESVIGRRDYLLSDRDADEDFKLFYSIKYEYTKDLKYPESRILYTISSISRGIYNRKHSNYGGPWWKTRKIKFEGKEYKGNIFLEKYCRPNYHGGFNYMNPDALQYHGPVAVVDCNSIYPHVSHWPMPAPVIIESGKGKPSKRYCNKYYYSVMKCKISVTLKDDGIPCILKDGAAGFGDGYITKCQNLKITLNSYDMTLLQQNYIIWRIEYISHITFVTTKYMFSDYIDPLYEHKRKTKGTERQLYKCLINNLIGSFAKKIHSDKDIAYIEEDGNIYVKREPLTPEELERAMYDVSGYVYLGAAITSAARLYIIGYIKKVDKDSYLYTDTDSIHIKGDKIPDFIPISDNMGAFKVEHRFEKVDYRGIKEYMYIENGKPGFTLAGISHISTELLKDVPEWCRGYQKKATFKQNAGRVMEAYRKHHISKLFEICLPCVVLEEDLEQGPHFESVWRPIISFERIKKKTRNRVHITVKPANIAEELEKLRRRDAWWEKKIAHKKVLPVDEWLEKIHKKEIEGKGQRDLKFNRAKQKYYLTTGQYDRIEEIFEPVTEPTPFDDILEN